MTAHSPVVEEPPSEISPLSRIVSSEDDSRLDFAELLEAVSHANLFYRARLETLAELAALRECKKTVSLFGPLKVGYDLSAYSKKSALELCWETIERVQILNERIALYKDRTHKKDLEEIKPVKVLVPPTEAKAKAVEWLRQRLATHQPYEDRIERSGKFFYFLIQVAGIAGGDVAESKASRDEAITSLRLRDLLAEHECADYLIKSFPDVVADSDSTFERDGRYRIAPPTKSTGQPRYAFSRCTECGTDFVDEKDKPTKKEFEFCGETAIAQGECKRTWLAKHPLDCELPKAAPRFSSDERDLANYAARHKDNDAVTVKHRPLKCSNCRSWVTTRHVCDAQETQPPTPHLALEKNKRPRGRGAIGMNRAEDEMIARLDLKRDLDIIAERLMSSDEPAIEIEKITKFDKKLWNKSPRAKAKWRIQ